MVKQGIKDVSLVFIGAGNLAVNLATALYREGFRIVQVYSRTEESAKSLAEKIDSDWTTALDRVTPEAELYIVSLKDTAFIKLIPQITAGKKNALFVHTAGSISMSIWEGSASRFGVLYPMQTFSKQHEVDFSEIPFFIEANGEEDAELLKKLASTLSGNIYEINSEQRRSLHLAAVFACNFTNHMYVLASDLLKKYDLPFDVMLSLIDETARKIHELSPLEAQTGPAIRYDGNVIGKHLDMLSGDPHLREIYQIISDSIHWRSLQKEE